MAGEEKKLSGSVATLRIRRVANGLEIFLQSEMIENFFRNLPGSQARKIKYGPLEGLMAYYFAEEVSPRLVDEEGRDVAKIWAINEELFIDGEINLSFFRLVGVSSGVNVVFPGVYSIRQIKDVVSAVKEALRILVDNYIKKEVKE